MCVCQTACVFVFCVSVCVSAFVCLRVCGAEGSPRDVEVPYFFIFGNSFQWCEDVPEMYDDSRFRHIVSAILGV